MDLSLIWKAALVVVGGTLLLRIAGRKSISQMTLVQTVIMIGIGSLLVQPIVGKNIWATFAVGFVLVLTQIAMEYLEVKSDAFEKLVTGQAISLIENGQIVEKNLKKLRLTVDQLEMQLRQVNVAKVGDVQWATLEPNGKMGYMLKEKAQPATKEDIQDVLNLINERLPYIRLADEQNRLVSKPIVPQSESGENIFTEVVHKGHDEPPPQRLQ
ncbi:hypothetical protein BEP19_02860 [Ammoniphilus oxalaticus]|uniref:YetF C-terminal domain-containing protein n=1 Tax=Ammoniphilus oxalaticus TaxID=66863 RepID=A0A419SNL2_9BACL|nr:DUF421 domain-containing protein [Ammoniphilus oxalaticus]RKD25886.1 hypothetical protein BEP19_02860 [Ammoniphilus oxalaticus]